MNADSEKIDNRGYELEGIGVRIIMQNDAISFILSRLWLPRLSWLSDKNKQNQFVSHLKKKHDEHN